MHRVIHRNNQGACEIWVPHHDILEIQKNHKKIIGKRYGKLTEYVPIQKWDVKLPQTNVNHHVVYIPRLNKLRITFVAYAQVHIGTKNKTKKIKVGAISLRSSNEQGGY